MDWIPHILMQLDFLTYLDTESVINFSSINTTLHTSSSLHIAQFLTFCLPVFYESTEEPLPPSFLCAVQKAKKIKWNCGIYPTRHSGFLAQFSITHLTLSGHFTALVDHKLPHSLTHLKFGRYFNQKVDNLPSNLIYLSFGYRFNNSVDKLPKNLQYLSFCTNSIFLGDFNQSLDSLPPSLKVLKIYTKFTKIITHLPKSLKVLYISKWNPQDCLPPYLTTLQHYRKDATSAIFDTSSCIWPHYLESLHTHACFDQQIDNLPQTLRYLNFGATFDQTVNCLPIHITHITFGDFFNKPVDNLPPSLIYLQFGCDFNSPVESLPQQLKILKFGFNFNQKVDNLPSSIRILTFGHDFNQTIDNLPRNLTFLQITTGKFKQSIMSFPPLKKLSLNYPDLTVEAHKIIKKGFPFPDSLTNLKFRFHMGLSGKTYDENDYNTIMKMQTIVDNLPRSITNLELFCAVTRMDYLPSFLTHLDIRQCAYLESLDNLPTTLKDLRINAYNICLDHLPENLVVLQTLNANQPVDHLPHSLTHLTILSKYFNHRIDYLPPSLSHLSISCIKFSQPIDHLPQHLKSLELTHYSGVIDNLPGSLRKLELEEKFKQHIDYLPKTLTHLTISADYYSLVQKMLPNITSCEWCDLRKDF